MLGLGFAGEGADVALGEVERDELRRGVGHHLHRFLDLGIGIVGCRLRVPPPSHNSWQGGGLARSRRG